MYVVETHDLIKRYGQDIALDHVNVNIEEGKIIGLLGPNGAGKSTFINTISSIIPYDSGHVQLFGKDMRKHLKALKKYIGIVPQELSVYYDISAYDNVSFFASLFGFRGNELKEQVKQAMMFTNLWDRRKDKPKKFSGGMKRRLNIACAIAHRPRLIIMDEPTVGVDPQSRNHILESVRYLNQQGTTIIYTTHYMEEVEALCHHVEIMDKGKIIVGGTLHQLKNMISDDHTIQIELSASNYTLVEAIKKIGGIKEVTMDHHILTIISQHKNIEAIVATVQASGGSIEGIHMKQSSLEDVFLTLTGRTLRD
ncbi:ABC transporter ATP-binding protein [Vallitalea pronyensis]|uniref:ABC transporter ATP-binding protein n=2 Tax=Vallitalea pronyensis TaxID=1348613 RepID=A0A8J8SJL2_9FIRM|nr:ABC transporter ATP-binding protein [Vallitalea pronyensis]